MNRNDFEKKLAALPVQEPDAFDRRMLAAADASDDGSAVPLDSVLEDLEEYSGRFVLRIPRSLHRSLKKAADTEGVSLNQYILYKLAR